MTAWEMVAMFLVAVVALALVYWMGLGDGRRAADDEWNERNENSIDDVEGFIIQRQRVLDGEEGSN